MPWLCQGKRLWDSRDGNLAGVTVWCRGRKVPTLLGVDISGAFDVLRRSKLLTQMKAMGFGDNSINLLENYFSDRTQQVEISGKRSKRRPNNTGVLQGSGLSPVLFLIYFLRGCHALKDCNSCKESIKNDKGEYARKCEKCGTATVYADDLNAVKRNKKEETKKTLEVQGNLIENTLKKLGLCMNKLKTQFIQCMSYQRLLPSRKLEEQ